MSRSVVYALLNVCVIAVCVCLCYGVSGIGSTATTLVVMLICLGFFIGFLKRKPVEIKIDSESSILKVKYKRLLFLKSEEIYNLNRVKFFFHSVGGARGAQLRELRLEFENKPIVNLRPDQDGWSQKKVESIFSALNDRIKFYHSPNNHG